LRECIGQRIECLIALLLEDHDSILSLIHLYRRVMRYVWRIAKQPRGVTTSAKAQKIAANKTIALDPRHGIPGAATCAHIEPRAG
jgi:hypothetical protein